MNNIVYARVFFDNKEQYVLIDLKTNTFQKVLPNYFEDNFVIEKDFFHLTEDIKFLPPTKPTKIVCLGLNYIDHTKELNMTIPEEPVIFLKPSSAVIGHKDSIVYPDNVGRVDYEGELAVVIKNIAKNVPKNNVKDHILGYTCFNDVTARDLQKKDGQWTRAKSFDTFAPIGPWIVPDIDTKNLDIQTLLNDKIVQNSNTKNMIFDIETVVSFISKIMTLYPGDVISLGTPPNVGPIKKGDKIVVKIQNIGELINFVV
jgi:2-keto-4-pentenoate hydratase/2-oxohepta-3-ene-1,7-dioic acid hydratase in catechol pathway